MGPLGLESTGMKPRMDNNITDFFNSIFSLKSGNGMVETLQPLYVTNRNMLYLDSQFQDRVVSRKSTRGMDWPARSPVLNPCDFFLMGVTEVQGLLFMASYHGSTGGQHTAGSGKLPASHDSKSHYGSEG